MLIATLIFAATLLLVPFIGGEFMPHLDEGALWVRATMPYTISFEEASRSLLRSATSSCPIRKSPWSVQS
jgi:Cu/Ag efflux pump CusA